MSNVIIGIERDIVLDYIAEQGQLIVYSRVASEKQFMLSHGLFQIIQQKIVFFTPAVLHSLKQANSMELPFSDARIRFFYRGRGLYFDSEIKKVKNGYAFTIPKEIQKMADQVSIQNRICTGFLYYSGSNNTPIECREHEDFLIFNNNRDENINEEEYLKQISKKFLNTNRKLESSIEGRAAPLFILGLTDSQILLGMKGNDISLQKDDVYALELQIPAGVLKRRIRLKCVLKEINTKQQTDNSQFGFTVICDLIGVKLEDQRFLYEQFYNKKFK
ncbi:MAG: hypothetical protein BKP49_01180 [Treponema sp. CETP13]|nr:MAG: hypothetical protein BKP49_01180 [Treponema sp. CETP13]